MIPSIARVTEGQNFQRILSLCAVNLNRVIVENKQ